MYRPVYFLCAVLCVVSAGYWQQRNEIINNEEAMAIGSKVKLTPKEERVNEKLMAAKRQELGDGFLRPDKFLPARHFFEARDDIIKSDVFQIIQKMPKGGALHCHDLALSSSDYVLNNITYRDDLYGSVADGDLHLIFAEKQPANWFPLRELRHRYKNFDALLKSKISLVTDNPNEKYPDVNSVWNAFANLFKTLGPLLTYRPVFEDYFRNALEEFNADNVNYMEIRGTLPELYELNGTKHDSVDVLGFIKNIADQFLSTHPDFIGLKYIYAPHRLVSNETMDKYIETYKRLKQTYPDFLLGFDLVGQEDLGKPLDSFVDQLTQISETTKFYFHAGETNWNGMSTDMNLIDAILLNVTRIGHGYALVKHPVILKLVKQRKIGIEINPISNQVLNLVRDIRNHPANVLIAQNYPVVISSDDPGLWDASGLSFDFYETFMGMASSSADLKLLKQLALNSILYSSMNRTEKNVAHTKFNTKWNQFIDDFLRNDSISVKIIN